MDLRAVEPTLYDFQLALCRRLVPPSLTERKACCEMHVRIIMFTTISKKVEQEDAWESI